MKGDSGTANGKPSPSEMYKEILKQWASQEPGEFQTAADYATAVRQWLHQCYYWQNVSSSFPYYLLTCFQQRPNFNDGQNWNTQFQPNQFTVNRNQQQQSFIAQARALFSVNEFDVPPLWKRFAAEIIDFIILFFVKLIVTFVAVDFFSIIDLDKYNITDLPTEILTNYNLAIEMTSDIVLLELIHKIVVCFFEAMCLHQGTVGVGGATPGKSMMGLKVVSCESVTDLGNNRVQVVPARDIGFPWALLRSFIKNFSMAFFFPVCFTLFFFQHNRTVYDIVCNCIVVEEVNRRPRRN